MLGQITIRTEFWSAYLWWGVIMIVVSLVVLVPLIASVHPVEVFRLAGPVLVMPPIHLHQHFWSKEHA